MHLSVKDNLLGIILVAGCSSNNTDELEQQDQDVSIVDPEENVEDDSDAEYTNDTVMNNGDLEEFPEFDTKAEYIDLDAYQGVVETDNKGNRIILFEDEKGHSEYKSIFIKHDNRLKIVQFKGDGLLYNGRDYKIITSAKKVEGNELGNHHLFYKRRISGGFLLF